MPIQLAPSPLPASSLPSRPNAIVPTMWLGNWLHQSSTRIFSVIGLGAAPTARAPLLGVSTESRPLATQPSVDATEAGQFGPFQGGARTPIPPLASYREENFGVG